MRVLHATIGSALLLAALAGCSKSSDTPEPEAAPEPRVETPLPPPAPVAAEAPARAEPEPAQNSVDALPPEEAPSPDAQMLEDADAAGLTARSVAPPDVMSEPPADPLSAPPSGGLEGGATP